MRFWLPEILQDFQMSGNSACIWPYPQLRSLSLPYCLETDLLLELYISPDFACLWDSLDKFDPLGEVDMGSTTQRQGMRVDIKSIEYCIRLLSGNGKLCCLVFPICSKGKQSGWGWWWRSQALGQIDGRRVGQLQSYTVISCSTSVEDRNHRRVSRTQAGDWAIGLTIIWLRNCPKLYLSTLQFGLSCFKHTTCQCLKFRAVLSEVLLYIAQKLFDFSFVWQMKCCGHFYLKNLVSACYYFLSAQ